jgi:hypothetical protein
MTMTSMAKSVPGPTGHQPTTSGSAPTRIKNGAPALIHMSGTKMQTIESGPRSPLCPGSGHQMDLVTPLCVALGPHMANGRPPQGHRREVNVPAV